MWNYRTPATFCAILALVLSGCSGGHRQWEITVENKGTSPCSFFIAFSNGSAKVEEVISGKTLTLIVGDRTTVIESVRVVHGKDEQVITPKTELPVGKKYAVVVGADRKVVVSILDR